MNTRVSSAGCGVVVLGLGEGSEGSVPLRQRFPEADI